MGEHGDDFRVEGKQLGELVAKKNEAYGDAISSVLDCIRVLYPEGIRPDQYEDLLLMVRVLDKLSRISKGDKQAFEENPWRDIAGYGVIGTVRADNKSFLPPIPDAD